MRCEAILISAFVPSSSSPLAAHLAQLFRFLSAQIQKQQLPLALHALVEVNVGLSRANRRAQVARQLVPTGLLFAAVSSGSSASWISRQRL